MVDPETMSAKLVIEEKSTGVVVEEITTGLTEEQAAGMNATVLKNGEAVQAGDTVAPRQLQLAKPLKTCKKQLETSTLTERSISLTPKKSHNTQRIQAAFSKKAFKF